MFEWAVARVRAPSPGGDSVRQNINKKNQNFEITNIFLHPDSGGYNCPPADSGGIEITVNSREGNSPVRDVFWRKDKGIGWVG